MFKLRTVFSALAAIVLGLVIGTQIYPQPAVASGGVCNPTVNNLPVCPSTAPSESASFLDPTATITNPTNISLGEKVYVAPFAELNATTAPITIAEDSNVQDQVRILASGTGAEIGPRVIMAHMATIKGAAKIGIQGSTGPFSDPVTNTQFNNTIPETFLSFNCEIDDATIERNTVVSFLSRVGPGVTLPAGKVVLPGKNVTTNSQASSGSLGKVANLTQADVALMEGIIEVNEAFAKGYTELARADLSNVQGINYAPVTSFNTGGLPQIGGSVTRYPNFRNRIIGNIVLQDSIATLDSKIGNRISLRADEGQPFNVGEIAGMANDVVFHALETTSLTLGNGIGYGPRVLVHGGRQVVNGVANGPETSVGDDVGLAPNSVIFRSSIGNKSAVGQRSAVFNSTLAPRTAIASRTIYANNGNTISLVEW
ncbi:isoleucine patch superfamily enzyme, carbonic anhydrase/acetyltransferase [Cylindrospermum stagnale PCC 7417]|uniref:Isoleucine patch superfamily enzyme, carbonic anhydrase/acetyltransferase n=1 Tax=Cylindrospermum stagnale PCC 7417 TaxID=56107 RepID=K9X0N7_9NOST|nr:carbonic anhydrase [Cylindrospermum stagnale]AFZ25619.1 isoleucine patch superfamily enzyme, carbonic anhydrase/acetyltransferase [Cylindrospermum stagnale PCC 7417]